MRSIVHIGLHKTGSTSLQYFFGQHRQKLMQLGIAYFRGRYIRDNHVELHVAAMRRDRSSTFKEIQGHEPTAAYRDDVRIRVAEHAQIHPDKSLLFSAEGLSLLRYPDEIGWLAETLPKPAEVVAVVRDVESYIASYGRKARTRSSRAVDEGSFADLGPDSWLRDIPGRIENFRPFFERVTTIDFDLAQATDGNVIPAFLRSLGIEDQFDRSDWENVYLNVTSDKKVSRNGRDCI